MSAMHYGLEEEDIDYVTSALKEGIKKIKIGSTGSQYPTKARSTS